MMSPLRVAAAGVGAGAGARAVAGAGARAGAAAGAASASATAPPTTTKSVYGSQQPLVGREGQGLTMTTYMTSTDAKVRKAIIMAYI